MNYEKQIELELQMQDNGKEHYLANVTKHADKGLFANTDAGTAITRAAIEPLVESITSWLDEEERRAKEENATRLTSWKMLKDVDRYQIAYITARTIISVMLKKNLVTSVAFAIVNEIEVEIDITRWREEQGKIADNILKVANKKPSHHSKVFGLKHKIKADGTQRKEWSDKEKQKLGIQLISRFVESTGVVDLEKSHTGKNIALHIVPNEKTTTWLEKFNLNRAMSRPRFTPCIIPPKDWETISGGGIHNTIMRPLNIIKHF